MEAIEYDTNAFYRLYDKYITSGIDMVHGGGVDGAPVYYDLQGRRVLYPKKGLYILNGNKVIIK